MLNSHSANEYAARPSIRQEGGLHMTTSRENGWQGPAIVSGVAGLAFWKSPETRGKVWSFLNEVAAHVDTEQKRRKLREQAVQRPPALAADLVSDRTGDLVLPSQDEIAQIIRGSIASDTVLPPA